MTNTLKLIVMLLCFSAGWLASTLVLTQLGFLMPAKPFDSLTTLFATIGAGTALYVFLFNLQRARSQDVLTAAGGMFQKAYESIKPEGTETLPRNSRLAWLTAARLLKMGVELGSSVTEPSHIKIYAAERHYWQGKFYDLIYPNYPEGLPENFYAAKPEHMVGYSGRLEQQPLSVRSLKYLYDFITWRSDEADPLEQVDNFTDAEIEKMIMFGPKGLGRLLQKVNEAQKT
ncbi:hypothetical protein GN316_06670 [Xylophilus sp. Kf1]|nr:hypothetical protein [Xylophilus sp. Kf1]